METGSWKKESGQALIVVLLVMSVVLTIALSVVSRSITDITVSRKEEEALRAFSAAEAGIEKALISGTGTGGIISGSLESTGATYRAVPTGLAQGASEFVVPLRLNSGESAAIWLVAHDSDGNIVCNGSNPCFTGSRIKVCWGDSGTSGSDSTTPAMEATVLYLTSGGDFATAKIARAAFDPNGSRRNDNRLAAADGACSLDGKQFAFSKEIDLSSLGVTARLNPTSAIGAYQMRIKLLYNTNKDHQFGVSVNFPQNGGSVLPQQGTKIESVGSAGDANRKIIVNRLYADLPPIFDFSIFSGSGSISK